MDLNAAEQAALQGLLKMESWASQTHKLPEDSQRRVFWAGVPNVHISRLMEGVPTLATSGTVPQRVALLNRIYQDQFTDYESKWYPQAHDLIASLAQDAPQVFDDGSVQYPAEAASRVQVQVARFLAGQAHQALDRPTLDRLAQIALKRGDGAQKVAWALSQLVDSHPVVEALVLACEDERIYTWPPVAPCLQVTTAQQALALVCQLSDSAHERAATLGLLRPHASELIDEVERLVLAYEAGANYTGLSQSAVILRRELGQPVSDALAEAFAKWNIELSGIDDTQSTREVFAAFPQPFRHEVLQKHPHSARSYFMLDLGEDPKLVIRALETLGDTAVDNYRVKYAVEAFSSLPPDFALPPLLEALQGKPRKGTAATGILTLGAWGDPRGVEVLLGFSGSSGKTNKLLADQALEEIGQRAIPALIASLGHKKKAVRVAAEAHLTALAQKGADLSSALAPALDQLQDKDLKERLAPLAQGALQHEETPLELARKTMNAALAHRLTHTFADKQWTRAYVHRHHPSFETNPTEACIALLDAFQYGDNSYHHRAASGLGDVKGEVSAWVLAEILRHMPPKMRTWNLKPLFHQATQKGKAMLEPALHALKLGPGAYGEVFLDIASAHGQPEHAALMVPSLAAAGKTTRERAIELLSHANPAHLGGVIELLTSRQKPTRLAAARVCRENPIPGSADALQAALDQERSEDVQAILSAALAKARADAPGTASAPPDTAALDLGAITAELRGARGRLPSFADLAQLPPLRLRSGELVPEEVRKGLLLRLKQESATFHDDRLDAIAEAFDQEDLDAFGRALYQLWGQDGHKANAKWAVFQLSVTSNEATLARFVRDLNAMASSGRHALAGWALIVCARHRSADGPAWNQHWANAAQTRGTRNKALEAREYAAERRGWTLDQLRQEVDSFILDTVADRALLADPQATLADLEPRFIEQAAMGRSFTAAALRQGLGAHPIFGPALAQIVFCAADGTLLTFHGDHGQDIHGAQVALDDQDTLSLVHPAALEPATLAQWKAKLPTQPLLQLEREVILADLSQQHSLKISAPAMKGSALASAIHRAGWRDDSPEDAGWIYGASRRFAPVELVGRIQHGGFVVSSPGFGKTPVTVESAYFTHIEGYEHTPLKEVPPGVISEFALELRDIGVTVL